MDFKKIFILGGNLTETVCILIFTIVIFLTLNIYWAFIFMVLGFFLCYIFGELLKIYKKDKKIFFKILSNHGNKFLLILTVLILLDIILTWVSVIYLEIARELNPFILKLWEIYGYDLGEFIYSVILFTIIGILHLFLNSKNDYLILFSFSSIILGIILWFPAVLNNLIILLMNI